MPGTTTDSGKRVFSGTSISSNGKVHNSAGQKIKNFFRITSSKHDNSAPTSEKGSLHGDTQQDGTLTPPSYTNKSSLRNSRFLPHIGRNRSTTVASEGNQLDDGMSPTAHANPYFQHQGLPALRHHDDGSMPGTPPESPTKSKKSIPGDGKNGGSTSGKEELARKLRRVASAPNAQGLFRTKGSGSRPQSSAEDDSTPLPKFNGIGQHNNTSALSMVETLPQNDSLLPVPGMDGTITPGKLRNSIAFRRTYSSNSIKVRNVEVGPGSFDKIKLIGKGDVGKVYLVREKKSSRLYAMKGRNRNFPSNVRH
jgi:protein-serine/threonine kinase